MDMQHMTEAGLVSIDTRQKMMAFDQSTFEQKMFLVAGVAIATVCASTNFAEAWVLARMPVKKSVRTLFFKSLNMSGFFAVCIPFFPIGVISEKGGAFVGKNAYENCYLSHSALILLTILTSVGSTTFLLLYHYLLSVREKKSGDVNLNGWKFVVVFIWLVSVALALLPWGGWNSWEQHDARCHLSTLWPLSFSVCLVFLMALSVMTAVFVWAAFRASQNQTEARRLRDSEANEANETRSGEASKETDAAVPIVPELSSFGHSGRVISVSWILTVAGAVPLVCHVLFASSCAASSTCRTSAHHYHEDAAALPWASLLITLAATINPLLFILSDDQVSSIIVTFLSRICCWCRRRGSRIMHRQGDTVSSEVDAYVTNDTAHLVAST